MYRQLCNGCLVQSNPRIQQVRGEMKLERRQLLSALQRSSSGYATLEAELHQYARELKARFRAVSFRLSADQKEHLKCLRELKHLRHLAAEHSELQLAFVNLLNLCGFARTSALRTPGSTPGRAPGRSRSSHTATGPLPPDDDDVIVEGEDADGTLDAQAEDASVSKTVWRRDVEKEQQEAARAELLLRAIDR